MQVTVSRRDLAKAAADCARIASTATSLPVLKNTLLEAGPAGLRVAATNLEQGLELQIPAQVTRDGQTTVPASELAQILANLPEGDLDLTQDGSRLTIRAGRSIYRVGVIGAEEMPAMIEVESQCEAEIEAEQLTPALSSAAWVPDEKETRVHCAAVYLSSRDGKLCAEATDTHVLLRRPMSPLRVSGAFAISIPVGAVREIIRILPNDATPILIRSDGGQVSIRFARTHFTSRLMASAWPKTDRVVFEDFSTGADLNREDFSAALRRLAVYTSAREAAEMLRVTVRDGACSLLAFSDLGHATEEIECVPVTGPGITFGVNAANLRKTLESLSCERVRLKLNEPLSPFRCDPANDDQSVSVIMPMRMDGWKIPAGED